MKHRNKYTREFKSRSIYPVTKSLNSIARSYWVYRKTNTFTTATSLP